MNEWLSYSELQLFRECQWKWKLTYLDKHRVKLHGIHFDFGTAIHAAIEKYRTRKDPITVDQAGDLFEEKFRSLYAKNHDKYKGKETTLDPEEFVAAGRHIIVHFHECQELATAEVMFNEHPLLVPIDRLDGLQIKFKGYIDMVIKTKDKRGNSILYVVDFKSCSWGWGRDKREDKELHMQLFLYKHFLCKKFGLDPKNVRTAFALLKKRPQKGTSPVEFFPISAGPVSVQRSLDVLNSDITRMASGKYEKNRKACVNDFGERCHFFGTDLCPERG